MNFESTSGLSQSQSSIFQSSLYYDYALFLDQARSAVTARMYSQQANSGDMHYQLL